MAGIGLGSAILGRRSENKADPLRFYAQLELMIAGSAAITPALLWAIRHAYVAMGGTLTLGLFAGTIVRLVMSALAIGFPTFLMGGTLPAVARAAATSEDTNRRSVALLYGINTFGAVAGVAAATFFCFEVWGNHLTLYMAAAVNGAVALAAFWMAKGLSPNESRAVRASSEPTTEGGAPIGFVFVAAAVAGFAFLLMELVWYRMLGPLLGGSTFTFGLILAVALFGIGLGGLIYAFFFGDSRITLNGFALVCALEAVCIILPYALGDRIALAAMFLRPLGSLGFYGTVIGWTAICLVVVLPTAIISGIQFPFLIALLGPGKSRVASDTGLAYASNTGGAIIGSLAGGFGLLPVLSAPGCWRLVSILLCAMAAAAACASVLQGRSRYRRLIPAMALIIGALWLGSAMGPTAFWRHSQIGTGRLVKLHGTPTEYHDLENAVRRDIVWEAEGVESSVALSSAGGLAFVVNGRCDGNAKGDSGTQIMAGLIPAALHEKPVRALVVGLGTGSTAGWLAAVPTIEKVNVVELEPSILHVAQACTAVNHDAPKNPKVHVIIGDGREVLLSTDEKYDVIASEPSNPYRAGVASLFTREFYEAVADRLNPDGVFAQWVQAYDVGVQTITTVYATMGSVFPQVDTWQTQQGDLLFVASVKPRALDADAVRARLAQEPFRDALINTWGVTNLEGFLAHFVADNSFAQAMVQTKKVPLNTDDQTVLEFAFARSMEAHEKFRVEELRAIARENHCDRPEFTRGEENINWGKVEQARLSMLIAPCEDPNRAEYDNDDGLAAAYASYAGGDSAKALQRWRENGNEINDLNDLRLVAESMADQADTGAVAYIDKLRQFAPVDADAILAHLLLQRGQFDAATDVLEKVFRNLRTNPWPSRDLTAHTLVAAQRVAAWADSDKPARRLFKAMRLPFCVYNSEESRAIRLFEIAMRIEKENYGKYTLQAVESVEPNVPWQLGFLKVRNACYHAMGSPLAPQAKRDLQQFLIEQPRRLEDMAISKRNPSEQPVASGYATEKPAP